jgi:hypothetical protein
MNSVNSIQISEVNFVPIKPLGGLIGFASCVYNRSFYLGSIAVHSRPDGGIRLVYPQIRGIDAFHPINRSVGGFLEAAVREKMQELY